MVKSEDFFSALHTIMTNKRSKNLSSEAGSNLKVRMRWKILLDFDIFHTHWSGVLNQFLYDKNVRKETGKDDQPWKV